MPSGFYKDPNHYKAADSLAGVRVVTDKPDGIFIIGTDDGLNWFALAGFAPDGAASKTILVDFSPKGGPMELKGTLGEDGGITWPDGNTWTVISDLDVTKFVKSDAKAAMDKSKIFKAGGLFRAGDGGFLAACEFSGQEECVII